MMPQQKRVKEYERAIGVVELSIDDLKAKLRSLGEHRLAIVKESYELQREIAAAESRNRDLAETLEASLKKSELQRLEMHADFDRIKTRAKADAEKAAAELKRTRDTERAALRNLADKLRRQADLDRAETERAKADADACRSALAMANSVLHDARSNASEATAACESGIAALAAEVALKKDVEAALRDVRSKKDIEAALANELSARRLQRASLTADLIAQQKACEALAAAVANKEE